MTTDFSQFCRGRRYTEVQLPGGGVARLQSLTAAEMTKHVISQPEAIQKHALITMCVVDEDGNTIWAPTQEDFAVLDRMDSMIFSALANAAMSLCIHDVDEQVKN